MKMRPLIVSFCASAVLLSSAQAIEMYNSSTLVNDGSGSTFYSGNFFNDDATVITFDDVLIDNALFNPAQQPINVTRIKFGVIQLQNGVGTTVDAYWGTVTTNPTSGEPAILDNASVAHIGQETIVPSVAGGLFEVEFGDGVNTLFTVNPNFTDVPGFGEFIVGLRFSDTTGDNGWLASSGPDTGTFNIYDHFPNIPATDVFFLEDDVALYVKIEGTPAVVEIPEPISAGVVSLGGLALMCRRTRKAS